MSGACSEGETDLEGHGVILNEIRLLVALSDVRKGEKQRGGGAADLPADAVTESVREVEVARTIAPVHDDASGSRFDLPAWNAWTGERGRGRRRTGFDELQSRTLSGLWRGVNTRGEEEEGEWTWTRSHTLFCLSERADTSSV